jgi:hypothetical protein
LLIGCAYIHFRELEKGVRGEQLGKAEARKEVVFLGTKYGLASEYPNITRS